MPYNKKLKAVFAAFLFACFLIPSAQSGQRPGRARAVADASPRLVVVIIVDQFRYDYLDRFGDLFGPGGFNRLAREGALFANANYDYAQTYTAPGHASIFTGSVPAQNGIVGNDWYDRLAGKRRIMVSDDDARTVTSLGVVGERGAPSPRVLIGTTISDEIRLSNNFQSKVVALSYKDRSAVLPGGRKPNGAYWYGAASGEFVTSSYYTSELPPWVKKFNSSDRADKYFGAKWERALPEEAYRRAQAKNLDLQRSPAGGGGLPYTITGGEEKPGRKFYDAFQFTPFASEYLVSFAKAAIEAEHLGEDQFPDLLSVSFSSPDLIGHAYGPDSQEVLDAFVRLDRTVAEFLTYVDKKIGLASTIIAVTGDHGVAPIPEYVSSMGFDAARIAARAVPDAVKKALAERFGDEKLFLTFVNDQVFLDHKLMADKKLDPADVERAAGEAALSVDGIVNYFTRSEIVEGRLPEGALSRLIVNGFNRQRSGDVWVVTRPHWFVTEGPLPTTHGSPYSYDRHVPVIFFGKGVKGGRYYAECAPSDIAPTLAAMLGVGLPSNRTGRVLAEAISSK